MTLHLLPFTPHLQAQLTQVALGWAWASKELSLTLVSSWSLGLEWPVRVFYRTLVHDSQHQDCFTMWEIKKTSTHLLAALPLQERQNHRKWTSYIDNSIRAQLAQRHSRTPPTSELLQDVAKNTVPTSELLHGMGEIYSWHQNCFKMWGQTTTSQNCSSKEI